MVRRLAILLPLLLATVLAAPAQQRSERMVAPGVRHIALVREAGPWVIHVLECDRSEPLVAPLPVLATGEVLGLAPLSRMAQELAAPGRIPVALVNADFFSMDAADRYQGDPLGLYLEGGELVSNPGERSSFLIGPAGELAIARPRLEAWVEHPAAGRMGVFALNQARPAGLLVAYTPRFGPSTRAPATGMEVTLAGLDRGLRPPLTCDLTVTGSNEAGDSPLSPGGLVLSGTGPAADYLRRLAVGDKVRLHVALLDCPFAPLHAVAGGPRLLREGQCTNSGDWVAERVTNSFAATRHPRTAVGFNERKLYLVTVDGRQATSVGMSLSELAALMQELGCREALNLDGGGSTEMWLRGRIANSPSGGAERAVANALALVSNAPIGPPDHILLPMAGIEALPGHAVPLPDAQVEDQYYNPLPLEPVTWESPCGLARVEQGRLLPMKAGRGTLVVSAGGARAELRLLVHAAPAKVTVEGAPTGGLPVGAAAQLCARAFTREGRELTLDQAAVRWTVRGGTLLAPGTVSASQPGEMLVTASVGGVAATVAIPVGEMLYSALEGFEQEQGWSFIGEPAGVTGSVAISTDQAHEGRHSLCLSYRLPAATTPQTAHARLNLRLGSARQAAIWVYGDGSGLWLRARLRDGGGQRVLVDLAPRLDWTGWRQVFITAPPNLKRPVLLESVYVADLHPSGRQGCLYLDQVEIPYLKGSSTQRRTTSVEPSYTVRRTRQPVKVDGVLDDPAWKEAPPIALSLSDGSGAPRQQTEAKLCWDDRYLYVAFAAVDSDIWGTYTRRDQPLYDEEVVEIFLCPTGDLHHYFEIELSPRNVVWDGRIHNPNLTRAGMQGDTSWDCPGLLTGVRVVGTLDCRDDLDQLWTAEMAIPFAAVAPQGRTPQPGDHWRGNLYRIDLGEVDEYSAWSPTMAVPASFHEPRYFGHLVFGDENA